MELIEELDARGILQSVASKNDFDAAMEQLEGFGLAEYFLSPRIGWSPKSSSVADIAAALNIGIDSSRSSTTSRSNWRKWRSGTRRCCASERTRSQRRSPNGRNSGPGSSPRNPATGVRCTAVPSSGTRRRGGEVNG
ncbi:hypothetical protein NKH18_49580 [Streptomyces sp. M10(2022)]